MSVLDEVQQWENTLREELSGLKFCKERVESDEEIPQSIKERFLDVIRSLKMNMVQIMARCTQLRSECLPPKALQARADRLKKEYQHALKNLEKLLNTAQVPGMAPRYQSPNFTSKMRQSPKKTVKRTRSASNMNKDDTMYNIVGRELTRLKDIIAKLQEEMQKHTHTQYEKRIRALEKENQNLRKQIDTIQEEHLELIKSLREIKQQMLPTEETYHERKTPPIPSRFKIREQTSETFTHLPSQHNLDSSLERPQSTPSKPRFLLKPSQDAEKALMR